MWAASEGNTALMEVLIEMGRSIVQTDRVSETLSISSRFMLNHVHSYRMAKHLSLLLLNMVKLKQQSFFSHILQQQRSWK